MQWHSGTGLRKCKEGLATLLNTCPVLSRISSQKQKLPQKVGIIQPLPHLGMICVGSQQDLTRRSHSGHETLLVHYFLIKMYQRPRFFMHGFIGLFSHPLLLFFLAFSLFRAELVWPNSVRQWKLLRQARVSMGHTKLDPGTYRGPEGNPANYSSSHGSSCCLSPSICGHRESADRPARFYLPSISIQGAEACQGFTGTGNVSLAPGVSVV